MNLPINASTETTLVKIKDLLAAKPVVTERFFYDGANNVEYIAYAAPGTLSSESEWQIKRIIYSGTNAVAILFAEGTSAFDKVLDNKNTYTYK